MLKAIGQRIKEQREQANLSQSKLAELTGYRDKTAISKIELGKVDLPLNKFVLIAETLGTTPAYLMDGNRATEIIEMFDRLNAEGQRKVYDYLTDLTASGRYKKESSGSKAG